jgi:hypothetical protein
MKNNKYNEFSKELGFTANNKQNTLLKNLLAVPKRDTNIDTPHTTNPMPNGSHQADLLFLPDDDGYKYCLVVVDLATRKTDAQPLKTKTSKSVLEAMKKIYKGKYLKLPHYLEVDDGTEFKGEFADYYKPLLTLRVKDAGRHRQQSVVETRNALLGRTLNKRMVAQEINTEVQSNEWVNFLPKVIAAINNHYTQKATHVDGNDPITGSANALHILPVGTEVRTQLDNPLNYLTGQRLHGKFRQGDIRWNQKPQPITQIYLRPANPPMYKVGNNPNVAYTKNQLQVVKTNEAKPSVKLQERFVINKLVKRFYKGKNVYFTVLWSDGSTTDEPRSVLIKDAPLLVKAFEK